MSDREPALNHVSVWSGNGWRRITAEEAAKLHPGGTVSARGGLFMCELCGQYVTFTNGEVYTRYFRHNSREKSKDCPDRTLRYYNVPPYNSNEHTLPLRIRVSPSTGFSFEIGFIRVPQNYFTTETRITITPSEGIRSFVYTPERLDREGVTYLSVGDQPTKEFSIKIENANRRIIDFWPESVPGVDADGTVFDADTGKKLPYDSDVTVNHKYYVVSQRFLWSGGTDLSVREIASKKIIGNASYRKWNVYEVTASKYSESAARFFLELRCRLTDSPVEIHPIWPVFCTDPYVIRHNKNYIFLYILGNIQNTRTFPEAKTIDLTPHNEPLPDGKVVKIIPNDRQQLISVGRNSPLQYLYYWHEPLNKTTHLPDVSVTDYNGAHLTGGICNTLPPKHMLRVSVPFDGLLVIKKDGIVVEKRKLVPNHPGEVNSISWGTEIKILVGLDCIWCATYSHPKRQQNGEEDLLKTLEAAHGDMIRIPHTVGNMASQLQSFPAVKKWLYTQIRKGYIKKDAYKSLMQFVIRYNQSGE